MAKSWSKPNKNGNDWVLLSLLGILLISLIVYIVLGIMGGFHNWDLLTSHQLLAFGISCIVGGIFFLFIGIKMGYWDVEIFKLGFQLIFNGLRAILEALKGIADAVD